MSTNATLYKIAKVFLLGMSVFALLFHFAVLCGFIPYDIVWGGRIQDESQMYVFESISIAINVVFLAVVAAKVGMLRLPVSAKLLNGALYVNSFIFALNTVGNLFSLSGFEMVVFTPITLLAAVFSFVLARDKPNHLKEV